MATIYRGIAEPSAVLSYDCSIMTDPSICWASRFVSTRTYTTVLWRTSIKWLSANTTTMWLSQLACHHSLGAYEQWRSISVFHSTALTYSFAARMLSKYSHNCRYLNITTSSSGISIAWFVDILKQPSRAPLNNSEELHGSPLCFEDFVFWTYFYVDDVVAKISLLIQPGSASCVG